MVEALAEIDDQRVVHAFVERSVRQDRPLREGGQEPAAEHPRFEGHIRGSETEQIADVSVEVVDRDGHVVGQLMLHADVVAERMRGVEALSDRGRTKLRRDDHVGQQAGRTENEIPRRLSDRRARLIRILLRRQPRQGLDVVDGDDGVGRNRRTARRHHVVEPIHADHRQRRRSREETACTVGGDLGIGQVADKIVGKAAARESAQQGNAGHERRRPVEPARKHQVLDLSLIGAAERRNVARQPQAELIVIDAETSADDGLRGHRPGSAYTRREVLLGLEFRIVVPAQAEIERQVVGQLPIVLHEERGVVVAQVNLVVSSGESSGVGEQIGAGRGGAESLEVLHRREQLII